MDELSQHREQLNVEARALYEQACRDRGPEMPPGVVAVPWDEIQGIQAFWVDEARRIRTCQPVIARTAT